LGRRIPPSSRNLFSRPANSIVAPQSFQSADEFHRRTAIFSVGRRIPLPRRNRFRSHLDRRNIIVLPFYLGRRIIVVPSYQI
jgi:hypothetical protein